MAGIQRSSHFSVGCALLLLTQWWAAAVGASAPPANDPLTATTSANIDQWLSHRSDQQVDHIPRVHRIEHWQALGTRHVLLGVDASRRYLLTLASDCHPLGWAQSVDVSRSGTAIWSYFDYLKADGERCSIGSIHQLSDDNNGPEGESRTEL